MNYFAGAISRAVPVGKDVTLTVTAETAVYFTAAQFPESPKFVQCQVQGETLRMTLDGDAPTSTNGMQLDAKWPSDLIPLTTLLAMKFIGESGAGSVWAQGMDV